MATVSVIQIAIAIVPSLPVSVAATPTLQTELVLSSAKPATPASCSESGGFVMSDVDRHDQTLKISCIYPSGE